MMLFSDVLPYAVGTPATYGFAGFNGRTPADNAPEAMLSLVTGTAMPSGLKPSVAAAFRAPDFPMLCRRERSSRAGSGLTLGHEVHPASLGVAG